MGYEPRFYRDWTKHNPLLFFSVCEKETDLLIYSDKNLAAEATTSVRHFRKQIEEIIKVFPQFLTSLKPVVLPDRYTAEIVREMVIKSTEIGVGPMAAVAGAIAEYVGRDLLKYTSELIIENGGDIFIKTAQKRVIGLYSGENSPFSRSIGLEIVPQDTPLGVCTSSGRVGHSLSLGKSDAVIVISSSAILADAAATGIGNLIKKTGDIEAGIDRAKKFRDISGIVIAIGEKIGFWGNIKIVKTS